MPIEGYLPKFVSGLCQTNSVSPIILAPKTNQTKVHSCAEIVPTWGTILFPLQIVTKSIQRRVQILHIQHEFNMFGSIWTVLLTPMLLFLGSFVGRRHVIVTFHTVLSPSAVSRELTSSLQRVPSFVPQIVFRVLLVFVYSLVGRFSNVVVVHSKSHVQVLRLYGIPLNKIRYIPHGVEARVASQTEPTAQTQSSQGKTILFFGFVVPRKGLEDLVKAMSIIRLRSSANLVIAGGIRPEYSSYYERLRKDISSSDLDERITFTGFVPTGDISQLYTRADVLVLPYTVPVGNSSPAMYAIGYGTPLVATRIFPFTDDFQDGLNAILVNPRDYKQLAEAIIHVIDDRVLRQELSENIARMAVGRDWNSVAQSFEGVYWKMVGQSQQTIPLQSSEDKERSFSKDSTPMAR